MRTATIALGVALVLAVFSCTPPPRPPAATAPEANALARLYAEGKAAYQAGRYAEAAAKFAQVVEADPQHVNAWINWGVALSRGGAPQQALDKFRQGPGP
ncbi:MAG: hypothetical protein KatS3mg131_2612 [Candidatus Tectimicrobiota bacterium]|nr:MAG: hypothetical protein KatS3mg131_2612 [Candidatus Tectomicrobia bacterium]